MAASQNAKTLAYRSISKAAVFLFSYNLSFNPRTTFCVKGKKSFSAIAKKNRTTFGRNFTLRNTRLQAVILQAYHAVITLDPGLYCSKGRLKNPCEGPPDFFFFFFFFLLFLFRLPWFSLWGYSNAVSPLWHIVQSANFSFPEMRCK